LGLGLGLGLDQLAYSSVLCLSTTNPYLAFKYNTFSLIIEFTTLIQLERWD
jgi:hypothetical protein